MPCATGVVDHGQARSNSTPCSSASERRRRAGDGERVVGASAARTRRGARHAVRAAWAVDGEAEADDVAGALEVGRARAPRGRARRAPRRAGRAATSSPTSRCRPSARTRRARRPRARPPRRMRQASRQALRQVDDRLLVTQRVVAGGLGGAPDRVVEREPAGGTVAERVGDGLDPSRPERGRWPARRRSPLVEEPSGEPRGAVEQRQPDPHTGGVGGVEHVAVPLGALAVPGAGLRLQRRPVDRQPDVVQAVLGEEREVLGEAGVEAVAERQVHAVLVHPHGERRADAPRCRCDRTGDRRSCTHVDRGRGRAEPEPLDRVGCAVDAGRRVSSCDVGCTGRTGPAAAQARRRRSTHAEPM